MGDFRQSVEKIKGTVGSAEPGRKMGPFTKFHGPHDNSLNWNDLTFLRQVSGGLPIYLKGVSSVEVCWVYVFKTDSAGPTDSEGTWRCRLYPVESRRQATRSVRECEDCLLTVIVQERDSTAYDVYQSRIPN